MANRPLQLTLNGQSVGPVDIPDDLPMIDYLHEYKNLTGSRLGCGQGICHACVVIVDNPDGTSEEVRTCITGAHYFEGKKVRTIEGHAKRDEQGKVTELNPIQQRSSTSSPSSAATARRVSSTPRPCWWKSCSASRSSKASWKRSSRTASATTSAAAPGTCATTAPRATC
jgi:hypothetical protein